MKQRTNSKKKKKKRKKRYVHWSCGEYEVHKVCTFTDNDYSKKNSYSYYIDIKIIHSSGCHNIEEIGVFLSFTILRDLRR